MARAVFKKNFFHPRYWPLWVGIGAVRLLVMLPYSWLRKLGILLGRGSYYFAPSRRYIIERNLELCFPELSLEERNKITKRNFIAMGIASMEMAISWWWPRKKFSKLVKQIDGLDHLKAAQDAGQGVIFMALHFTTLEIGAALIATQISLTGMYRKHKNEFFEYIQRSRRERMNLDADAVEREDIREMIKIIRGGGTIWYAPDQDYGKKQSLFVPLFGVPAATVTATTKFARLGKAIVIPFVQKPMPDGSGYQLTIYPPLDNFPGESEQLDCLRINQWVEYCVKQQVDQYLWAHRRFKSRPDGEPSLYKKADSNDNN